MFYYGLFLFLFFFIHRLFSETTRPIPHQIFRNCVFWCSLNNPIVLKFFWRYLAEKNSLKTAKIWSKFQGLTQIFDNNFKTVKDNSNLKQIWTRGIVSLHFWKISFGTVPGTAEIHLPNWVTKSVFLSDCYIFFANSKTIQPICTQLPGKLCILK